MTKRMLLLALLIAGPIHADQGSDAVRAMGQLNGEALACRQPALVERIRMRIINEAPKSREIGEIFEAATTAGFLAMGNDKSACDDGRTLAERIELATQALRAAFGTATK